MPFYLSAWEGSGTAEDGFTPQGASQASAWAAADLRPDSTSGSGRCLLWTDVDVTGTGLIELPALDTELSTPQANAVSNALGIARGRIVGHTTRTLAGALLTAMAADLGIPELRGGRDGVRRVRMGLAGVVWDEERDA